MSTISLPIKGDADKKLGAYNAPLSVSAQDTPNMTVRIRPGSFYNSNGELTEFAGGNSPQISTPQMHARWSVLGITNQGSVMMVDGIAQPLPQLPAMPTGVLPLAALYITATTTSINNTLIQDVRPFLRSVDPVENVEHQLAERPTFTDMNNTLNGKADVDGTPNTEFVLNKHFVSGSPTAEARISVRRGSYSSPAIRWSETAGRWEISNDGVTFGGIASTEGIFAPLHHTHPSSDVIGLNEAVAEAIEATDIPIEQITNLCTVLNNKANEADFKLHTNDKSIHFTLPIAQSEVLGLEEELANKVNNNGALFSGNVTVMAPGCQPITMTSDESGSSGIEVDRKDGKPAARIEWDESSNVWLVGTSGNMNTIVSGKGGRIVETVAGRTGDVTLSPVDVVGFEDEVKKIIHSTDDGDVTSVNGLTGEVVLTPSDVGAAPVSHTHLAVQVVDFDSTVRHLVPQMGDILVTSVHSKTGDVYLTYDDVHAAAAVHRHEVEDVKGFDAAVKALIPAQDVTTVAGRKGDVVVTTGDLADFDDAVKALIPAQDVTSVAGRKGDVVVTTKDLADFDTEVKKSAPVTSVAGRTGEITVATTDLADFGTAVSALVPVTKVAGRTGEVVVTTKDLADFNTEVGKLIPAQDVTSVAGRKGAVVVTTKDLADFNTEVGKLVPVTKVAGRTGEVVVTTKDLADFTTAVKALIPEQVNAVNSVNGQTGTIVLKAGDIGAAEAVHKHVAADITDFDTEVKKLIPAQDVTSVAGRTGDVVVTTKDLADFSTEVGKLVPVTKVAGRTGDVVITSTDVTDFDTAVKALVPVQDVTSVAGKKGDVNITTSDLADFDDAVKALFPAPKASAVESVNGHQGKVVLTTVDLTDFDEEVKKRVPVTKVAGRTGDVVLTTADVTDFTTAVEKMIPAQKVTSVNTRTGDVTLLHTDVGAAAASHTHDGTDIVNLDETVKKYMETQQVTSVNGNVGEVVVDADNVAIKFTSGVVSEMKDDSALVVYLQGLEEVIKSMQKQIRNLENPNP